MPPKSRIYWSRIGMKFGAAGVAGRLAEMRLDGVILGLHNLLEED